MSSDRHPEDRVCGTCDGILRWYPWRGGGGYLHVRASGRFYVTGHKPAPKPSI
ncbi:hypothetical protein [Streptomyces sp. NPDC005244]|uniref:hypothetical protein n=1 Tax=Streptomyces sp. NPDC005244 TaxID=3364708 RepID=UPI003676E0BF